MSLPPQNVLSFLLAAAPLLLVVYLMAVRNWGGSRAGPAGWLLAVLLAVTYFGGDGLLLWVSLGRALLLALFVLYIIWMALLLYHVVNEAGAITVIGQELPGLAPDRPGQALLLAWIFGSFLQGASGFGVPAAVIAPLLVGLQFRPETAVAVALLGHGWAVTFGSLGSSFLALVAATGLPGELLAGPSAALLALCCLGCGLGVLLAAGNGRQRWRFLLGMAALMGGVQWLLATAGLWTLAAFGAGLAGLAAAIVVLSVQRRSGLRPFGHAQDRQAQPPGEAQPPADWARLLQAFVPYAILVGVILVGQLALGPLLDAVTLNLDFPAVRTSYGWETPAGPGRSISLFGHAGALLLYGSVLAFVWFKWRGTLLAAGQDGYRALPIVRKTARGSTKSTISIITLVAMAITMQHAGMTQLLAVALSEGTGALFPALSPFLGALGAFVTGSNTNSNVVFAGLQQQTALALGLPLALILAAQTAGGAIGSIFAPAKVVVGCSTVGGADDGYVLKLATAYGVGILLVLGVVVWLAAGL